MFREQDAESIGDVIARLWIFTFFTMIFRDLHEMAVASTIEGILSGTFEGNPVTDAGLVAGGGVLVLLLTTIVLSTTLKPYAARRLNLVLSPLAIVGGYYIFPNDPDDYLFAAVTTAALLAIFLISFFWRTDDARNPLGGVQNDA